MWKACYEGTIVAERFYDEGFNVAVLDYRVNPYSYKTTQQDAIRAVRYLRYHAKELNTLPDKIGMMGFSGGAMLTGWCATKFDQGNPEAADPVERCSSRPDAAVLCYGAGSWLPVPAVPSLRKMPLNGMSLRHARRFSSGNVRGWMTRAMLPN